MPSCQHQLAYGTDLCTAVLQHGLVFGTICGLGKGGAATQLLAAEVPLGLAGSCY